MKQKHPDTMRFTLRLKPETLATIIKDAEERSISANRVLNEILDNYYRWTKYAGQAGFISVRRIFVSKLLEDRSDEEILDIAKYVSAKTAKNVTLFMKTEYSLESVLSVTDAWLKIIGLPYTHDVNGLHHTYLIRHDMGANWSKYLANLLMLVGKEFGIRGMRSRPLDDSLFMEFDFPSKLKTKN